MLSSGGMPSSHSSTVTALAAYIGLQEGTGSSSFAIAVVLACVVRTHNTQFSSYKYAELQEKHTKGFRRYFNYSSR